MPSPPLLAERIVSAVATNSAFGSSLIGDLREGFELRARRSARDARWWYWRQTSSIALHILASRIARPAIVRDARYAARRLRHAPVFTAAVVITLALGIGANTAILQLIDNFYLRKLPVPAPERIVGIYTVDTRLRGANRLRGAEWSSFDTFHALQRARLDAVQPLAAYTMTSVQGTGDIGADPTWTAAVFGDYFETLGIRPQRGRFIRADENDAAGASAVVISDRVWRERFGANEQVLGRSVQIGTGTFTIVGVAPPGFTGIHPEGRTDLWIPGTALAAATSVAPSANPPKPNVQIFGRLTRGSTVAALQAACDNFTRTSSATGAAHDQRGLFVHVRDRLTSYETSPAAVNGFIILGMLVALLHLAACTNVASLMMARDSARRREIGVRLCLGASRADILRLSLLEAAILASFGGAGGLLIARWIAGAIGQMQFLSASMWVLDWRIAALVAAVSALTLLQFGLAPAMDTASIDPLAIVRGAFGGGARRRDRSEIIVIVQVAISVALLANAAAFVGLFRRQVKADPGYDISHVALVHFDERSSRAPLSDRDARYEDLIQRARFIPGVRAVAAAVGAPLFNTKWTGELTVAGATVGPLPQQTSLQAVGPGYFAAIGGNIVAGRDFDLRDRATSRATRDHFDVVIVNEALARRLFGGNAVGRRLQLGRGRSSTIIGVARNLHDVSTIADVPRAYFPLLESSFDQFDLVVRTDDDASLSTSRIRASLRDGAGAFPSVQTLTEVRDQLTAVSRAASSGLTAGALVALFLMSIGIFGIVSMSAARRRAELGIRIALGASSRQIHQLLLSGIGRLITVGTCIGLFCATVIVIVERSWLGPTLGPELVTSAIALLTLLVSAGSAAFIPSRRATRQPPAEVLRSA